MPRKRKDESEGERAELVRMRAELAAKLADVDALIEQIGADPRRATRAEVPRNEAGKRPGKPVRLLVLDALEDLGWMAYSREVAQYCEALYGRRIPSERFGTLGYDEMRAFGTGASTRPVWLCFGVTHNRHEPIKRLLGRSDWPLEWRIVAPTSGRVQHLKITANLCDLALRAREAAADPEMLRTMAMDHARDIPGVRVRRDTPDFAGWRDVARELLAELEEKDEAARRESAERLARRPAYHQLFGMPDVLDGAAADGPRGVAGGTRSRA
jgi:hypothetical protein